jgi:preprotein translocase subunit SecF
MFIIKHKVLFVSISGALVALALIALAVFGLKIGIDFKGGALTEVTYTGSRPSQTQVESDIAPLNYGAVVVQPTGQAGYIIKSRALSDDEHTALLSALSENGKSPLTETNYTSIGPSVGQQLAEKAVIAIIVVVLAIICFIAFSFRKVSQPVSSWKYGIIAIVALLHDVTIPTGIYVLFCKFAGAEVDTLFVVALLTILGLSVSDTIVIFDRIRENLRHDKSARNNFSETVGKSLDQSFTRSLATSLSVIFALLSLYFFGPDSTKYFALVLVAGMFFGTYSSIFLASPLLVFSEERQRRKAAKGKNQ